MACSLLFPFVPFLFPFVPFLFPFMGVQPARCAGPAFTPFTLAFFPRSSEFLSGRETCQQEEKCLILLLNRGKAYKITEKRLKRLKNAINVHTNGVNRLKYGFH